MSAKHRKGNIKILIDPAIKRKAMSSHKSQFLGNMPFTRLPKSFVRKFMAEEHFVSEKI